MNLNDDSKVMDTLFTAVAFCLWLGTDQLISNEFWKWVVFGLIPIFLGIGGYFTNISWYSMYISSVSTRKFTNIMTIFLGFFFVLHTVLVEYKFKLALSDAFINSFDEVSLWIFVIAVGLYILINLLFWIFDVLSKATFLR